MPCESFIDRPQLHWCWNNVWVDRPQPPPDPAPTLQPCTYASCVTILTDSASCRSAEILASPRMVAIEKRKKRPHRAPTTRPFFGRSSIGREWKVTTYVPHVRDANNQCSRRQETGSMESIMRALFCMNEDLLSLTSSSSVEYRSCWLRRPSTSCAAKDPYWPLLVISPSCAPLAGAQREDALRACPTVTGSRHELVPQGRVHLDSCAITEKAKQSAMSLSASEVNGNSSLSSWPEDPSRLRTVKSRAGTVGIHLCLSIPVCGMN